MKEYGGSLSSTPSGAKSRPHDIRTGMGLTKGGLVILGSDGSIGRCIEVSSRIEGSYGVLKESESFRT